MPTPITKTRSPMVSSRTGTGVALPRRRGQGRAPAPAPGSGAHVDSSLTFRVALLRPGQPGNALALDGRGRAPPADHGGYANLRWEADDPWPPTGRRACARDARSR